MNVPMTPVEFSTNCNTFDSNGFINHLLSMSDRIKVYLGTGTFDGKHSFLNNRDDNKGFYFIKDDDIFIPYGLPNIIHEISHFVEINDLNRLTKDDFGFSPIKDGILLLEKNAKFFFAAAARESRVRGIERSICTKRDSRLTQNHYWNNMAAGHMPFGRFNDKTDFVNWSDDLHNKTIKAWSKDRIECEWKVRLDFVHNWMEGPRN